MNVTINENAVSIPDGVATWGQLIDWLETDYLKVGQCITKVAVDGQERINYRSPSACQTTLSNVGQILVESSEFDTVLRETLAELEREICAAIEASGQFVTLLEARDEVQAYGALAKLLDAVGIIFAITCEDVGWVDPPNIEIPRPAIPSMLERALSQLITAQESRSWLMVCDILQYEIIPILDSWKSIIRSTRSSQN